MLTHQRQNIGSIPLDARLSKSELMELSNSRPNDLRSVYDASRWVAAVNTTPKSEIVAEVCRTISKLIDERPRHRAALFAKYDVEEYSGGNRVVPRLLTGAQFTADPDGKYWPHGSRGVEGFMEHLQPREQFESLLKRVESQANAWLQTNRDKKLASFSVMYQSLMGGAKYSEWEVGMQARLFVVVHWEKLEIPLPVWVDRRLNLLAYPPCGVVDAPFNFKGAEAMLNRFRADRPNRVVTGLTSTHRKEVRPGDGDGQRKDQFLFGLVTEEDYSGATAVPQQKFEMCVGYGSPGVFWDKLKWIENAPNQSLRANAAWDVRGMTNQFFYGELLEAGRGLGGRNTTLFLYEKPSSGPGRDPRKERAARVWVQANEAPVVNGERAYWPGNDYDKTIEGRAALAVATRPEWLVRHNKVQHDWGQYFDGDSPTDRVIGFMLQERR